MNFIAKQKIYQDPRSTLSQGPWPLWPLWRDTHKSFGPNDKFVGKLETVVKTKFLEKGHKKWSFSWHIIAYIYEIGLEFLFLFCHLNRPRNVLIRCVCTTKLFQDLNFKQNTKSTRWPMRMITSLNSSHFCYFHGYFFNTGQWKYDINAKKETLWIVPKFGSFL